MGVRRARVSACRGASLVETLVAVAVFAVGVVSLTPVTVSSVRANGMGAVRSRALVLAQAKVEEWRALPYDALAALAPGEEVPAPGFRRTWQVLAPWAQPGDGDDLRRLLVTVSWDLPGTGAGAVSLPASYGRY